MSFREMVGQGLFQVLEVLQRSLSASQMVELAMKLPTSQALRGSGVNGKARR